MKPDPNDGPARILVVDNDSSDIESLVVALNDEGFDVAVATTGAEGLRLFTESPPDIVLLEVLLPDGSGIELCRRIGALTDVPVVLMSTLSDELEVVLGLELGATDFVTKPYRRQELIARIRAVLRRSGAQHTRGASPVEDSMTGSGQEEDPVATIGPIEVHFVSRQLHVGGQPVHLSRREFDLLAMLASPPGIVRTRDQLIDRVWSGAELSATRTLDKHIASLRAKIEPEPTRPKYLVTVHGVGFRLRVPSPAKKHTSK